MIGWQHFGPLLENQNFTRYGIGGQISRTALVSILDYFQDKKFSKNPENHTLGAILGSFLPKFGQKWISLEKRALTRYSNYLPSCQKSEKTNEPFLRKMLNWRTNRETNGDLKDPPLEGVQKTFIRDRGVVKLFAKLFITRSVLISGEGEG